MAWTVMLQVLLRLTTLDAIPAPGAVTPPPAADWRVAVGYVTQITLVAVVISIAVAVLIKIMALMLRRSESSENA